MLALPALPALCCQPALQHLLPRNQSGVRGSLQSQRQCSSINRGVKMLHKNVVNTSNPGDLVHHLRPYLYLESALVQPPASGVICANRNPKHGQENPTIHTKLNQFLPGSRICPMDVNCSFLCQSLEFTLVQHHLLLWLAG